LLWRVLSSKCMSLSTASTHHHVWCSSCLRADRCLGCEHECAQREILLGVDNSNMIVGLQHERGFVTRCGNVVDDRWRVSFGPTFDHMLNGRAPSVGSVVVGSTIDKNTDGAWKAMMTLIEDRGWTHHIESVPIARKQGFSEKEVDATLMMRLKDAMHRMWPVRGTLCLFTSDRDFLPLVKSFVEARWKIELCRWDSRRTRGMTQLADESLVRHVSIPVRAPLVFRVGFVRLGARAYRAQSSAPKIALMVRPGTDTFDRRVQEAFNMLSAHLTNKCGLPITYNLYSKVLLYFTSPCAEDHLRRMYSDRGARVIRDCEIVALRYLKRIFAGGSRAQLLDRSDIAAWESVDVSTPYFRTHEEAWSVVWASLATPCVQIQASPPRYVDDFEQL
jgi:hypothetical protein